MLAKLLCLEDRISTCIVLVMDIVHSELSPHTMVSTMIGSSAQPLRLVFEHFPWLLLLLPPIPSWAERLLTGPACVGQVFFNQDSGVHRHLLTSCHQGVLVFTVAVKGPTPAQARPQPCTAINMTLCNVDPKP